MTIAALVFLLIAVFLVGYLVGNAIAYKKFVDILSKIENEDYDQ